MLDKHSTTSDTVDLTPQVGGVVLSPLHRWEGREVSEEHASDWPSCSLNLSLCSEAVQPPSQLFSKQLQMTPTLAQGDTRPAPGLLLVGLSRGIRAWLGF